MQVLFTLRDFLAGIYILKMRGVNTHLGFHFSPIGISYLDKSGIYTLRNEV